MFKPLLRTLPTLSGNVTLACKLKEIVKDSNNEFHTYVRYSNFMPLQNNVFDKNIELNMLNGKYEYDIAKFYNIYSNIFYNENFTYNKKNYALLDLDSLYESNNDGRNKDYEFGCKRIKYSQSGYQFSFYAPFYVDDVNDLPKYFLLHIRFNDHLVKRIKIYINSDYKANYLGKYLKDYVKQFDDRVIFCLPDSLQATYFGIDVKKGGLIQYKDNEIGALYVNQTTINNFDNTICEGFKRNKLVMSQVIPLSFMFNVNDLLNDYEKEFFEGYQLSIYGYYCSNNDIDYPFYDFDINYTHAYNKYLKYDEYTGKYSHSFGKSDSGENINILNVGYPALNESKYIKYAYTNKITPRYCKFKMMLSSDNDPYITNLNYGYTYLQNPNQKYGYFPTMFKGIYPQAYIDGKDLRLPIGNDMEKYYKTSKYYANAVQTNTTNIDKYIKLMTNYTSSWYTINHKISANVFEDRTLWSDVKYDYTYYKGILYNLNELRDYNIDKFSVFLNPEMKYVSESKITNSIVKANCVLSKSDVSQHTINNYNDSYNMKNNIDISIDSIHLASSQYIDTGIIPDGTYGIELDFSVERKTDCTYMGLTNKRGTSSRFNIGCDKNGFFIGWGNFYYLDVPYDTKRHKIQLNYLNNKRAIIDEKIKLELDDLSFTPEYSIWIGAANWSGSMRYLYPSRIYGVKITQGNEIIHNYVPIEENGYGYLYDTITEERIETLKNGGKQDVAEYYGISYSYYNKLYDLNSTSSQQSYIMINKLMTQDNKGKYVEEVNYDAENTYYKYNDIYNIISNIYGNEDILNELDTFKMKGYFLLDAQNNINYFESYYDVYGTKLNRFMLTESLFGTNDYNETYNWLKESLYYTDTRSTDKKLVIDTYEDIDYNEDVYGKLAFFIADNYIHTNDVFNFIRINFINSTIDGDTIDAVINKINTLSKYSFIRYNEENDILLKDYFVKTPTTYCNVYVDPYNINNLITEYNKKKPAENKIPLINSSDKTSNMFIKIINKDHLIEYGKKLNGDENGILEIERKSLFNYIYVKNRNWIIDTNNIDIKDTYITLDEFIMSYDLTYNEKFNEDESHTDEYIKLLSFANKYKEVKNTYTLYETIDWLCELLSDNRSSKNNFIFKIAEREITVDLCFKKKMVLLNENLMKLMYEDNTLNNYLMLYITDACKNTNEEIWNILSSSDLNNKTYENIDNYLTPIFTNVYINDYDNSTLYSMLSKGKIKDNKYIYNAGKNFKEIDILSTIKSITDETKIDSLNNIISSNDLSLKWYEYALNKLDDEENSELYEAYAKNIINELNNNQIKEYIYLKIDFLYETDIDVFYKYVKSNNIVLYSLYDIMSINYDIIVESDINIEDMTYIEKYNMFIYNYKGLNYGFYYLNFNLDNTNNSFNVLNDYNLNIQFDTINGKDLQSYSSEYFDSIFPILHPFMKTNIFNEFAKNNKTIIYPYEAEILIKYAPAKSNELLEKQFVMLKDNDSDILYDSISKLNNEKKIKLLRYFNYITPYLKETNIIQDCWELKFMKPNSFEDIDKYSIFYKNDISIYKYNGIKAFYGDYNKVTLEYENIDNLSQYEYKHFNDNMMFNLPEEIIINDDNLYSTSEIETLKNKNNLVNRKKQILLRYFTKKKLNYKDIILFLYNKYDSSLFVDKKRLNAIKNEYTYKISYKFTLI